MANINNKTDEILSKPHDSFFKAGFSKTEVAENMLEKTLPKAVLDKVDLGTLKLSKDSFVDKKLNQYFSDLIYTVRIKDGTEIYLSFLLEHKSSVEHNTILQIMKYILGVWEAKLKKINDPLPIVIPILVYHGEQKEWTPKLDIREMINNFFDLPKEIQEMIPVFKHFLLNITKYEREQLEVFNALTKGIIFLLRVKSYSDIGLAIEELLIISDEIVIESPEEFRWFIEIALNYLARTQKGVTDEMIEEKIKKLGGKGKMVMTILDEREKKGEEKKAKEVAIEMINDGLPMDKILKYSKLPEEIVINLKNQFGKQAHLAH